MVTETGFDSHGTRCAATYLGARGDALTGERGRPCVVMGHGFGATRDGGLLPFAERFAAAGADVLMFDYRGYGTSDGTPRQDVNHLRHRQDYHAAIEHARGLPGVDRDRIVLWGSSYSGGHVVPVAARDGQVAAVISQGAIVAQGTPHELKARVEQNGVVEIEVYGVDQASVERIESLHGVIAVTVEEHETKQLLVVQTAPGAELTHVILAQLEGAGVGRVSSREPTLEDAYVQLVTA